MVWPQLTHLRHAWGDGACVCVYAAGERALTHAAWTFNILSVYITHRWCYGCSLALSCVKAFWKWAPASAMWLLKKILIWDWWKNWREKWLLQFGIKTGESRIRSWAKWDWAHSGEWVLWYSCRWIDLRGAERWCRGGRSCPGLGMSSTPTSTTWPKTTMTTSGTPSRSSIG